MYSQEMKDHTNDMCFPSQDVVDDQLPFEEVLKQFFLWIESNDIELDGPKPNAIFVTCGDWDLLTMLPKQCGLSGLPVPTIMKSWVNIKKVSQGH